MARPRKCRKVCSLPFRTRFVPSGTRARHGVVMTVDEYETIRLIDYEGFDQQQCANYMHIARTTAQQIYDCARKKLSQALVEGKTLEIKGGEYELCDRAENFCKCGGCNKHRCMKTQLSEEE